jgi:hypothetical protein
MSRRVVTWHRLLSVSARPVSYIAYFVKYGPPWILFLTLSRLFLSHSRPNTGKGTQGTRI